MVYGEVWQHGALISNALAATPILLVICRLHQQRRIDAGRNPLGFFPNAAKSRESSYSCVYLAACISLFAFTHMGLGELENHSFVDEGQPSIRDTHALPSLTKYAKKPECGSDLTQTRVAPPNTLLWAAGLTSAVLLDSGTYA
jgi:hypothetical protein